MENIRELRAVVSVLSGIFGLCLPGLSMADIERFSGDPQPLPHDAYVNVVDTAQSPVMETYIKSRDGVYVAAAIRKPQGDGPFPAIVLFHGAPGGIEIRL